jgi:hypothetical protein
MSCSKTITTVWVRGSIVPGTTAYRRRIRASAEKLSIQLACTLRTNGERQTRTRVIESISLTLSSRAERIEMVAAILSDLANQWVLVVADPCCPDQVFQRFRKGV